MILFACLIIASIIVSVPLISATVIGGSILFLMFGDVIVFFLIVSALVRFVRWIKN